MKYTFMCVDDGKKIIVESDNVCLVDSSGFGLLYDFKCFLLASGFTIKGDIDIVDDFGEPDELYDNIDDDGC